MMDTYTTLVVVAVVAAVASWLAWVAWTRRKWADRIAATGQADYRTVGRLLAVYEAPFISRAASQMGFFGTFAAPGIARLLLATREFTGAGPKRYSDTELLLGEVVERSSDPLRADAAIARVNAIHAAYPSITLDEYLYTLCLFVVPPVRWMNAWAWRSLSRKEEDAMAWAWAEVAARMGIPAASIPLSYAEFEALYARYVTPGSPHYILGKDPANEALAAAMIDVARGWIPCLLRPLLAPLVPHVLAALMPPFLPPLLGLAAPHPALAWSVRSALSLRSVFVRFCLPPRPESWPYLVTPHAAPCPAAAAASSARAPAPAPCPHAAACGFEGVGPAWVHGHGTVAHDNADAWLARWRKRYGESGQRSTGKKRD